MVRGRGLGRSDVDGARESAGAEPRTELAMSRCSFLQASDGMVGRRDLGPGGTEAGSMYVVVRWRLGRGVSVFGVGVLACVSWVGERAGGRDARMDGLEAKSSRVGMLGWFREGVARWKTGGGVE